MVEFHLEAAIAKLSSGLGLLVLHHVGCGAGGDAPPAPDLTAELASGEARAGVVIDEAALFGGGSAEGRVGDVKIYNDRVQFVVQRDRAGDYYIGQSGGVVDADLVRPADQPGRDFVDDWAGMYGLGRLMAATEVDIVRDGSFGGPAMVRAAGPAGALALLTGSVESPDLISDLGLQIATDYVLWPDSWWLEVHTTLTATDQEASFEPGDFIMGGMEAGAPWNPGAGYGGAPGDVALSGFVERRGAGVVAIGAWPGELLATGGVVQLLAELADLVGGFGETVTLAPGESVTYKRLYGVAPDVATLTDDLLVRSGAAVESVTGMVSSSAGPVVGARVTVSVGDEPYTMALTDEDGRYDVLVPSGREVNVVVDGRGRGLFFDLPAGFAEAGAYSAESAMEASLESHASGARVVPEAQGFGVAEGAGDVQLVAPGRIRVVVDDGGPFEAQVQALDADEPVDERAVQGRPSGRHAIGWARGGELSLDVEPGTYRVVVHRGIRHEVHEQDVVVEEGGLVDLDASLPLAYDHRSFLLGDPHSHAAPSGDGEISMTERLMVAAGVGIQVHFGTDHDHIADYRPLRDAMGLDEVLATVVADEVSPVLRGHANAYPLVQDRSAPNGGAYAWWSQLVESTDDQFARLEELYPGAVLQLNHPLDSGVAAAAGWSEGLIANPDFWTTRFGAVEVLNAGDFDEYLAFYLDLVNRGVLVTPTGVSDSHGHISGDVGASATFLGMGTDDPAAYTDDALLEAMGARRTIVTRGPFLEMSVEPGATVVGEAELEVTARAPSWIVVDRLRLLRDGVEVEVADGASATFSLQPGEDASYVVIAEGDTPMAPVYPGITPWAMSSPILVDVAGDGWTAPLPSLALGG